MLTRHDIVDRLKPHIPLRYRRVLNQARFAVRRQTPGLRMLPGALIIGAMRAGTSSLYKYLARHPQLAPSLRKETEFFTWEYHRGLSWYRAHFPTYVGATLQQWHSDPTIAYEATPYYLFHPLAAERCAKHLPQARIIALLRDPIARAHSHHKHMARHGLEPHPFEVALDLEAERLADQEIRIELEPGYRALAHHRYSYVSRGLYAQQLQRWYAVYPRAQLLVLRSEDLYEQPRETFSRITQFLGISVWIPPSFRNHSYLREGHAVRVRNEAMAPHLRERLADVFAPHNRALYQLLECEEMWPQR